MNKQQQVSADDGILTEAQLSAVMRDFIPVCFKREKGNHHEASPSPEAAPEAHSQA